jgi:hypothetical protein
MKTTIALFALLSFTTISATEIDGVQYNCFEKSSQRMAKYKRLSLVSVCRDRASKNLEHYTFCDGSGCTGFTSNSFKSCNTTDWWNGQDDQDQIDQTEWKESCLTADDFKK